jgi:hypothetical protein
LVLYDVQKGKTIENIDFTDVEGVKLCQTDNLDLSDRGRTACEGKWSYEVEWNVWNSL